MAKRQKTTVNNKGKPAGAHAREEDRRQKTSRPADGTADEGRAFAEMTRLAFQNAPHAIALVAKGGILVRANRAARKFFAQLGDIADHEPLPCGDAFACTNAADGCGKGQACPNCVVRKSIEKTFRTGQAVCGEVGLLRVVRDGVARDIELQVNTSLLPGCGNSHALLTLADAAGMKEIHSERELTIELLRLTNSTADLHDLTREVTLLMQQWTGCEAVGIRLRDGVDFPYCETRGFPAEFVQLENRLCARDSADEPVRDSSGDPIIECMCGNVICGRFDPSRPFFTKGGSFYTNSTTELLATTTPKERLARTRNKCNDLGYESLALVPIPGRGRNLGLLQFNSKQAGRFNPEMIELLERLAANLGAALGQSIADTATRKSEAALKQAQRVARVGSWVWHMQTDHLEWSDEMFRIFGVDKDRFTGKLSDVIAAAIHPDDRQAVGAANEQVIRAGKSEPLEYRVVAPDGTVRWVYAEAGELLLDEAGRPKVLTGIVQDITERRLAEEALRQSDEKYRLIFETMLTGFALHEIILDPAGRPIDYRFLEVNPAFERQTGLLAKDIIGRTVRQVIPDIEEYWVEAYGNVAVTGEPLTFENYNKALNQWFHVVAYRPAPGQFACGILDITEQKHAEQELRGSEERFRSLIEQSPIAIGIAREGYTFYVNDAYRRMFGLSESDSVLGYSLLEQIAPQCHAALAELIRLRVMGKQAPSAYETTGLRKDGSQFPMGVITARLNLSDGPATVAFLTNLEERDRAQQEKDKLQAQFLQAQKMEAVGRLSAGVAHDFNNQLTVILGYCDILLHDRPTSDPLHDSITQIQQAARRAQATTSHLLSFSRKQILKPEPVDLDAFLQELTGPISRLIGEDIKFIVEPGMDVPAVFIDKAGLHQAVTNLVVNARDAMPEGGKITLRTSYVHLSDAAAAEYHEAPAGSYALLEVIDSGTGIDKATMDRIFDPFFTTKDQGKGTGLGLPMVQGFVRQSHGFLSIHSVKGKGTTVRLLLPPMQNKAQDMAEKLFGSPKTPS